MIYPDVYIEEISKGVRTITGVPTSITAFIGRALRGPLDEPCPISSFADFERIFGGLWSESMMSYAVQHYYQNGGSEAVIVRIANNAAAATITLPNGPTLTAKYQGSWGNRLRARIDYKTGPANMQTYTLNVRDLGTGIEERYLDVSTNVNAPRALDKLLQQSLLVKATAGQDIRPDAHALVATGEDPFADPPVALPPVPGKFTQATGGNDGNELTDVQYVGAEANKTGIYALLKTDIFNLLVIPPISRQTDVRSDTLSKAAKLCLDRRAMLLVDVPQGWDVDQASGSLLDTFIGNFSKDLARNTALFFPHLGVVDSQMGGALEYFGLTGAVAGIFARSDALRGVWKAPAGTEMAITGVRELKLKISDAENRRLNLLGVNCLRTFPTIGTVMWGTRTLSGGDQLDDDNYKYVPVRRLTLFIEESLYRGMQWAVFEPNGEPLWAQIRLIVSDFMNNLFRQGAFQGLTPGEAYFVKCDKETNSQNDINRGIVNIVVGFAPLKPAEFVIIKIQQRSGQIEV